MNLTKEQVRTGILEYLNYNFHLQTENVQIDDKTNLQVEFDWDELDCQFIAWDLNVLFDIQIPEKKEEDFLNCSFRELVNYVCTLSPTIGQEGRDGPTYAPSGALLWDPTVMNHIDSVLSGKIKPTYTLYPKSPDTTNWAKICATIREEQQEQEIQKIRESKRQEDLAWHEYLEKERKRKRRNIIIVTLILSAMAGVALARHYVIKNRRKDTKLATEHFEQEEQKMTKFIQFPIQKVK